MLKFRRPVLSILSALLICALLMTSSPVLDTLINPEGPSSGSSEVLAYDPCADCAGTYDAWKKAEADWENCPDKSSWSCLKPYRDAEFKYKMCRAWDCDTGEPRVTAELNCSFDYELIEPMIISFDASGSTGNITRYCWLFGESEAKISDGKLVYHEIKYGPTVQHKYSEPGTYGVILHVDSGEGTESSQCRFQISVGQDILKIESINPPEVLDFNVESEWKLNFKYEVVSENTANQGNMQLEIYDQDGKCLYDKVKEIFIGIGTYDDQISPLITIPSGTTELTFKAYLHVPGIDGPTAFAEEFYHFETLELVKFFSHAPHPGKLGEFYDVDVELVDREENKPWTYMFNTSAGKFLYSGDWLPYSQSHHPYLQLDSKDVTIKWHSPTRASNLELQYAKKMIQVTEGLARNLSATGSSTIPVIGRVVKTANDVYNLVDYIKTAGGYAGKSWQAMTRGELLRAVLYAANATVEGVQVTAGGILLIPKALAPAGVKEVANAFTDAAHAGIDYIQVSCETLTEALVEEAKASRVIWVSLLVRVTNNELDWCGGYIIVELQY